MGLVNLQTDLKSLKFGKDRFGGGDSGQPFIKNPIINEPSKLTHGDDDFLLRGGLKAPIRAAEDVARLTKYLFNIKSPKGLLFIAKQNLLSRTSVATEASINAAYGNSPSKDLAWTKAPINQGIYNPLSTIAQAGVNFAGGHLNLLGINPASPLSGIVNAKFLQPLSLVRYEDVVRNQTGLTKTVKGTKIKFVKPDRVGVPSIDASPTGYRGVPVEEKTKEKVPIGDYENRLLYLWEKDVIVTDNRGGDLLSYVGGPGSVLGIGKTRIKFADRQRTGINNILASRDDTKDYFYNGGVRLHDYIQTQNYSRNIALSYESDLTNDEIGIDVNGNLQNVFGPSSNQQILKPGSNPTLDPLYGKSNLKDATIEEDFRKSLPDSDKKKTFIGISPNYKTKNIENRVNLGDPGKKGDVSNYTLGKNKTYEALDKLTALPIYTSTGVQKNSQEYPVNDLVKFRIAVLHNDSTDNKTFVHFRSFINKFSENYKASWKSQKYMGRAEDFYKYDGFGRDISIDFTVVAQSKPELIEMYKKLNYLASTLAPTYTKSGYMAGNLSQLTLGGYLYEQPGFIESLSYDIPDESPWEIGIDNTDKVNDDSVKELPMIINVSMKFTPIHNFIPSINKNGNGSQRYIALSNGISNYDNNTIPQGVEIQPNNELN